MVSTDLFLKVQIQHEERDPPEKLAGEICRQIRKIYGVRAAELSHYTTTESAAEE